MKNKLILLTFVLISLFAVGTVQAATTTERECSTDSYGNVTCRDKITNVETGEITYTNETVTYSSQTLSYQDGVQTAEILNAGLPENVTIIAAVIVLFGVVSFILKKRSA